PYCLIYGDAGESGVCSIVCNMSFNIDNCVSTPIPYKKPETGNQQPETDTGRPLPRFLPCAAKSEFNTMYVYTPTGVCVCVCVRQNVPKL
ncbi:MAG: hypothetical protein LBG72_10590, partial [Spirochaetaceae bacterium]|nr:hypothetical protein [Spirochaetaceae bacterium]